MCAASMGAVRATPTDAPSGMQAGYIHVPHDDTAHFLLYLINFSVVLWLYRKLL